MDTTVLARHDSELATIGQQPYRLIPHWFCDAWAAEVFKELNETCCVAAQDIDVAISIPIKTAWSRQGSAFQRIGFLLKILWSRKQGQPVSHLIQVFNECDPTVFVSNDQVLISIAVPIKRDRDNHLDGHVKHLAAVVLKRSTSGILGFRSRSDVLDESELVEKLATQQIQVAVFVQVNEVGRRATENFQSLTSRVHKKWHFIVRIHR